MKQKVTDEMLMGFVDGEIDADTAAMIERTLAADPGLASRAEKLRASRVVLREAFGDARREPVPDALVSAALGETSGRREASILTFAPRNWAKAALPLAACLAVAFGMGGYLAGQAGAPTAATSDAFARAELAEALSQTMSGQSRQVAIAGESAEFTTLATYRIEQGLCRSFELSGSDIALSGIGCDRGEGWAVDLTAVRPGSGEVYAPASDAAIQSMDAYLDALEASMPLGAEEEASLDTSPASP